MKTIKDKINSIQEYLDENISYIVMILFIMVSFWLPDLLIRYVAYKSPISYYDWLGLAPNFFTISYIIVFIILFNFFSRKSKQLFYIIISLLTDFLFLGQYLHLKIFSKFLVPSDLLLAGEGLNFATDIIPNITKKFILSFAVVLIIQVTTLFIIRKVNPKELQLDKKLIHWLILLLFSRIVGNVSLGVPSISDSFDASFNPRNIYMDYGTNTEAFQVSGTYEFFIKNLIILVEKTYSKNITNMHLEIDSYFEQQKIDNNPNEFTSLFKGKNLIYILLESVDDWVITEKNMPTLHMMQETGWDFTNRYAPAYGGGWTFNSEFAANSGLYSVVNYKAAYTFDNNNFKYSLPNLFKEDGYTVNSMHVNWGRFYNRSSIHKALGFENHYPLVEMADALGEEILELYDDKILMDNDKIYDLLVDKDNKFMSHYTSYSGHLPFDDSNMLCENMYDERLEILHLEERCYTISLNSVDIFLEKLIKRLKNDDLLDDTVIILYSDHYNYGITDQTLIEEKKKTNDSNLLQKVPFIIWSTQIEAKNINTLVGTADFVPTIANLFGLTNYSPKNYLSTDIFSKYHDDLIIFSDGSWYDGKYYSKNIPEKVNNEYVASINKKVLEYNKLNELILISDYYNR